MERAHGVVKRIYGGHTSLSTISVLPVQFKDRYSNRTPSKLHLFSTLWLSSSDHFQKYALKNIVSLEPVLRPIESDLTSNGHESTDHRSLKNSPLARRRPINGSLLFRYPRSSTDTRVCSKIFIESSQSYFSTNEFQRSFRATVSTVCAKSVRIWQFLWPTTLRSDQIRALDETSLDSRLTNSIEPKRNSSSPDRIQSSSNGSLVPLTPRLRRFYRQEQRSRSSFSERYIIPPKACSSTHQASQLDIEP